MTIEELNQVFEWLNKEANKSGLYFFKLNDYNTISSYHKETGLKISQFYINAVIEIIREWEK